MRTVLLYRFSAVIFLTVMELIFFEKYLSKMTRSILICILFFGCLRNVIAQKPGYDTAFVTQAISNAYSTYRHGLREHLTLYNGSDHTLYRSISGEHPYFGSDDWISGSVIFNENRYDDVELRYNLWTDKLILDNYSGVYAIQLNSDEVQGFKIGDHVFVRLNNNVIQQGFYELLLNEAIKVYARRTKALQEQVSDLKVNRFFIEKSKYYVFQNGQYFLIKGKKTIIQLFRNRKKEINQFLRQNNIIFSKDREKAIVRITKFYSEN
jgi:hypothetical protein